MNASATKRPLDPGRGAAIGGTPTQMEARNLPGDVCLYHGALFDGENYCTEGGVIFGTQGVIAVFEGAPPRTTPNRIDVSGRLIVPGLVDLHSDALEKCIEMRPGVLFDADFALQNLDRRVAACGITTGLVEANYLACPTAPPIQSDHPGLGR